MIICLNNKVILIYYVFTIMYDLFPISWQLINSCKMWLVWIKRNFWQLDWLALQNWKFFHSKSFTRNRKSYSLLGQNPENKMDVIKLIIQVQELS